MKGGSTVSKLHAAGVSFPGVVLKRCMAFSYSLLAGIYGAIKHLQLFVGMVPNRGFQLIL